MSHRLPQRHTLALLPALMLGLCAGATHAAGFQLLEQNASGIGASFAGSAALAEDASTVFFNPAGMTLLAPDKKHVSAGVDLINLSTKFSDRGSTAAVAQALGGGDGGEAGGIAGVPHGYFVMPLTERINFGLGIGAPFGLKTEYDADWKGRYLARRSAVETININPSLSFKVNDQLSLGIGANWQRLQGEFSSAVNNRAIVGGIAQQLAANPLTRLLAGAVNAQVQNAGTGHSEIEGDDDAWGYNLGILYKISPETRLGLSYRSKIKYHLNGSARFSSDTGLTNTMNILGVAPQVAAMVSAALPSRGGAIHSDIELPDTWILSTVHQVNDQWDLMGDISWTGWSSIQRLDFKYADNGQTFSSTREEWRDTLRAAVGTRYRMDNNWTWRFGLAYDQTPVADDNRTPRMPDGDRTWLSFGGRYNLDDNSAIDFGYAHLFVKKVTINDDADSTANVYGNLLGRYKSSVDILGVQYSVSF